jgi:hypothetical protein
MRQGRRRQRRRRCELVVGEPQRERWVEHGNTALFELVEMADSVIDSVECRPDVHPPERHIGRLQLAQRTFGSDDEASSAPRRCRREAEVRFRRVLGMMAILTLTIGRERMVSKRETLATRNAPALRIDGG